MRSDSRRLTVDQADATSPGKVVGAITTTRLAVNNGLRTGYLYIISSRAGYVIQAGWVGLRRSCLRLVDNSGIHGWFRRRIAALTAAADAQESVEKSDATQSGQTSASSPRSAFMHAAMRLARLLRWSAEHLIHGMVFVILQGKTLVQRLVMVWFEKEPADPNALAATGVEPMGVTRRHSRGAARPDARTAPVVREKTRSLDRRTDGEGPTNRVEIRCWSCAVASAISGVRQGGCYLCPSCGKLMEVFDLPSGRSRPFVNRSSAYGRETEVDELPPLPQP